MRSCFKRNAWLLGILFLAGIFTADAADKKDLQKALSDGKREEVAEVAGELARSGGAENVKLLLAAAAKLPGSLDDLYWPVIHGIAAFTDAPALEVVADLLVKQKTAALARDILFGLRSNGSRAVVKVHQAVLEQRLPDDLRTMSVDQLGALRFVESVDLLLATWEQEQKKGSGLKQQLESALVAMMGESMGDLDNWRGWWEVQRPKGVPARKKSESGGTGTAADDRPGLTSIIEKPAGKVLVLRSDCDMHGGEACNFDHIQNILTQMKVPNEVVDRLEFEKPEFRLDGVMALIVNCTNIFDHCVCKTCKPTGENQNRMKTCGDCNVHIPKNHRFTDLGVKKIKAFVEQGGSLFSEDWGLIDILERAWPTHVAKGENIHEEQTVGVNPARGATSHPMMRGVFERPPEEKHRGRDDGPEGTVSDDPQKQEGSEIDNTHAWVIDEDSPAIKVVNPKLVTLLLVSPKVNELAKNKGQDAVALTFVVGQQRKKAKDDRPTTQDHRRTVHESSGGRVLHVLSHFGKQQSREDEFALQNILINFIVDAHRNYGAEP